MHFIIFPKVYVNGIVDTGVKSNVNEQYILIDNLKLENGPCPPSLSCSFNSDSPECEWKDFFNEDANLFWNTGKGASNIINTPK